MSRFDSDAKTARDWMVGIGVELLRVANREEDFVTALVDKATVVAVCAGMPDEIVLRLRCFPGVFNLQA